MGRRRDSPDFIRSNKIPALDYRPAARERELTRKLIASTSAGEREVLGQNLLDSICRSLKIPRVRLRVFEKRQPHKLRDGKLAYKLFGVYYCDSAIIEIANLTSIRKQTVAGKTFLDTLIHELMHHVDRKFLRIPSTPHSYGFYARIADLKNKLMRAKGAEHPSSQEAAWQRPENLTAALEMAITDARASDIPQNPAIPDASARPGTGKPRWSPPEKPQPLVPATQGESGAAKPRNKTPRTPGEKDTSPSHSPKNTPSEKDPQLSFGF